MRHKIFKSQHTYTDMKRALARHNGNGWRLPTKWELRQVLRSPSLDKLQGLFWSAHIEVSAVEESEYYTQLGKRGCECYVHKSVRDHAISKAGVVLVKL